MHGYGMIGFVEFVSYSCMHALKLQITCMHNILLYEPKINMIVNCMHVTFIMKENLIFRVSHLAGVFARSLKEKLKKDAELVPLDETKTSKLYTFHDEEVICVQIAGLCHDLGIIIIIITCIVVCISSWQSLTN